MNGLRAAVLMFVLALVSALTNVVAEQPTATASARLGRSTTITLDYSTLIPNAGNSSLGYFKYQNIRFAAAPTGALRFAKPQWPTHETGVNNGSLAAADVACASTEDCLFMDIWVPTNATGRKLPVMVWTYGGGFTGGSKSENTPEGLFSLSTDFIFVAYNYRVGIAGLANGPTLLHEGGVSNAALWDVQHAFQWVKKYIAHFGGDPDTVTAVGFSAGASQTLFQITRFAGHNQQLFDRAYVMSPGFVPGAGHQHSEVFWQNVSSAVNCPGGHLECMRKINFTTLNTAANNLVSKYTYQFQPRVDGDFVADTYEAQFYQKRFNFKGPMVITHEQHEANSQAWSGVNTTQDVSTYLKLFFPSITDDVVNETLTLYPEAEYTSPGLRFSDMKQSFDLTAHNLAVTNALQNKTWNAEVGLTPATHGTDQAYYWYSTYSLASSSQDSGSTTTDNAGNGTISGMTGSNATSNAGGLGGMTGGGGFGGSTSVNSTIAIMMQKYLLSFVLTGNPNTLWPNDKINWPQYGNSSGPGTQLIFNDTFSLGKDDLANDRGIFWNKALWY